MSPILRLLLGIIAVVFIIWSIWAGYTVWRSGWQPFQGIDVALLAVFFLVLTVAFVIASTIQDYTIQMTKQQLDLLLMDTYRGLLQKGVDYFYTLQDATSKEAFEAVRVEAQTEFLLLQSNQKILAAMNRLNKLMAQNASIAEQRDAFTILVLAIRNDKSGSSYPLKKELKLFLEQLPKK